MYRPLAIPLNRNAGGPVYDVGGAIAPFAPPPRPAWVVAFQKKDEKTIRDLFEGGGDSATSLDINIQEPLLNKTPLHFAVEFGLTSIVDFLLARGAHVDIRDVNGYTCLHIAAEYKRHKLFDALILAGANVNERTPHGDTPLTVAIDNFDPEGGIKLLERGAHANVSRGSGGVTPLLDAVGFDRNTDLIHALIAAGANVNATDRRGETPLARAIRFKSSAHADILRAHGAVMS